MCSTQCIRNTCLRLWMDEWGIGANDLQTACSRLAHAVAFVAPLNAQARQVAAARALTVARREGLRRRFTRKSGDGHDDVGRRREK
jgi:putative transposase